MIIENGLERGVLVGSEEEITIWLRACERVPEIKQTKRLSPKAAYYWFLPDHNINTIEQRIFDEWERLTDGN